MTPRKPHAVLLSTLVPLLVAGCAVRRVPLDPDFQSPTASQPESPAPCAWVVVENPDQQFGGTTPIEHRVNKSNPSGKLTLRNDTEDAWITRTNGNGLSLVRYIESPRQQGLSFLLGHWAGWESTDSPGLDPPLLVDPAGKILIESDAQGTFLGILQSEGSARGTALLLSGADFGRSTTSLRDELVKDGWTVLEIINMPFGIGNDRALHWHTSMTPQAFAGFLASEADRDMRHILGVTDAAFSVLHDRQPDLAQRPLVIVGASAGALQLPGVYESLRDREPAAVLIAGGGPLVEVLRGTWLRDWKGPDRMIKAFLDENAEAIETEYAERVSRDPLSLAPLLPRERTLMVHASSDGWIPADTGDTLWEAAGRPERWIFPGGHIALFLTLDWIADDITEWIDAQVPTQD